MRTTHELYNNVSSTDRNSVKNICATGLQKIKNNSTDLKACILRKIALKCAF